MLALSEEKKRVWDVGIGLAGLILAVVGGLFAARQYLESLHKDRISYTMEYAKEYHSDALIAARGVFGDRVRAILEATDKQVAAGAVKEPGPVLIVNSLYGALKEDQFRTAVRAMLNFYEEMYACAQAEICDRDTSLSMFASDAQSFFAFIHPYLCAERKRWNDSQMDSAVESFFMDESSPISCDGAPEPTIGVASLDSAG